MSGLPEFEISAAHALARLQATLAFADAEIVSRGKIAILMGSFASAVLGTVLIFLFSKKKTRI